MTVIPFQFSTEQRYRPAFMSDLARFGVVFAPDDPPSDPGAVDPPADPAGAGDQPPPEPDPTPTDPKPDDWRASIEDPDLRKLADRYSTPADMAKAVREGRQMISGMVKVPGKDASDEERAAFLKALGVPESAEGYDVALPEGLPEELQPTEAGQERLSAFVSKMHEAGATPAQVNAAVATYFEMIQEDLSAQQAADKRYTEESEAQLRKDWPGEEYKRNQAFASRAAQFAFGDDFEAAKQLQTSDGRFLLDNPTLMRALAKIGREMGEDRIGPSLSDADKSSVRDQITEVRAKREQARAAGRAGEAQRLDEQERALWAKLAGNQPVVGAQGRVA